MLAIALNIISCAQLVKMWSGIFVEYAALLYVSEQRKKVKNKTIVMSSLLLVVSAGAHAALSGSKLTLGAGIMDGWEKHQ